MTAPDVDMVERLGSNIDTFLEVHRAEIMLMCDQLKIDADLLLMEYIMHGFNSVKTIVMEAMERDGMDYNKRLMEIKGYIAMTRRAEEDADA